MRVGLLLEHRALEKQVRFSFRRTHSHLSSAHIYTLPCAIRLLRCTGSGARFREPLLIYFRAAPPSHSTAGDIAAQTPAYLLHQRPSTTLERSERAAGTDNFGIAVATTIFQFIYFGIEPFILGFLLLFFISGISDWSNEQQKHQY